MLDLQGTIGHFFRQPQKFCWASALPRARHSLAPPRAKRGGAAAPLPARLPSMSAPACYGLRQRLCGTFDYLAIAHAHTPLHHTTLRPFPCWRAQQHHKQPASIAVAASFRTHPSFRTHHRRRRWLLVPSLALGQQWLGQAGALTPRSTTTWLACQCRPDSDVRTWMQLLVCSVPS